MSFRGTSLAREMVEDFVPVPEIIGLYGILASVNWTEPWLLALIAFHCTILLLTITTRNNGNIQAGLFVILLLFVLSAEKLNEMGAMYWQRFAKQMYFDSRGMFISIVFSMPLLFCSLLMVGNWIAQSSQLLISVKQQQARHSMKKQAVKQD